MKFDYSLTFSTIQNGGFENQLKQFCIDNKFIYSIKWNSFANMSHTVWVNIIWIKNKKFPGGEFVRYPDGTIKKDKEVLCHLLRYFPSNISLTDAKEFLALEVLQQLYSYSYTYNPKNQEERAKNPFEHLKNSSLEKPDKPECTQES